jgi:DNA-binding GntR family transcriptional regulator
VDDHLLHRAPERGFAISKFVPLNYSALLFYRKAHERLAAP